MKTKTIIITLLSIWFFNVSVNAQSNQGPTLDETIDFLGMKTKGLLYCEDRGYTQFRIKDFTYITDGQNEGCIYVYHYDNNYSEKHYIDLYKLTSIEMQGSSICFKPDSVIKRTFDGYNGIMIRYQNVSCFEYGNDTPRVYKAWLHLMKLLNIRLTGNEEKERQEKRNKEVDSLF